MSKSDLRITFSFVDRLPWFVATKMADVSLDASRTRSFLPSLISKSAVDTEKGK